MEQSENPTPKIVFIVPYRDRLQQQQFFSRHMKAMMEDYAPFDYKIFYVHQCDNREFNRGAMKNIGFLMLKDTYPTDYQNITLVFNDIDTMPLTKNFFNYDTTPGKIKHFYGFEYTLGGIVSIKASDFESVGGFPNFWAWGYEDNLLQKRVKAANFTIDRTQFYPIMDKNILLLHDGVNRSVNKQEFARYIHQTKEGFHSIHNLKYDVDSANGFINVHYFTTEVNPTPTQNKQYDLRNGPVVFKNSEVLPRRRAAMKMIL